MERKAESETTVERRHGATFVNAIPEGASVVAYKNRLVVAHPDHVPLIYEPDTGQGVPLLPPA